MTTTKRNRRLPEYMVDNTGTYPGIYGLTELPAWVPITEENSHRREGETYTGDPVWSSAVFHGLPEPPKIGDRVDVVINGFGSGEVIGYFVESGFLGIYVVPDERPKWHRLQNPDRPYCMVFGAEVAAR